MGLRDNVRRLFRGQAPDDSTNPDWLKEIADFGDQRLSDYQLFEDTYDGKHGVKLGTRLKAFLEGNGIEFSENYCDAVIDYLADTLEVTSFTVVDDEQATNWINDTMWPAAGLALLQATIHTKVPMLGDGFVIVGYDEEADLPTFDWNHPSLIRPVYSDEADELVYAPKKWTTRAVSDQNPKGRVIWRMNVYFPDRIEKWFSSDQDGEQWAAYYEDFDEDTGEAVWPLPWTDDNDEPLGLNVFHFRNRALGNALGRSDLLGAIPFQREINKQVVDLAEVMDQQGAPQRWGSGIQTEDSLRVAVGEYLKAADPNARFGQLDPADPLKSVETIKATMRRMGSKTGTPFAIDLNEGAMPSGESLKTARMRLTERGKACQVSFGGAYAAMTAYGWKLKTVFGASTDGVPEFDPEARVVANWESLEIRNEAEEAATAEAHYRLGVSRTTLQRRLGYDPAEEATLRAVEDREISERRAAAFNAGDPDVLAP